MHINPKFQPRNSRQESKNSNSKFQIFAIFIVFLIFSLFLVQHASRAVASSEYESDSNLVFGLIGTAGSGATYELSPSKLFTFDKNFGQNLYKLIYQRVSTEGSNKALDKVIKARGLSGTEIAQLVPGSNIRALLKKPMPGMQLSPTDVQKNQMELLNELNEERILAELEVESKMSVEPTEFFANGDESDSGFDLLVDLDMIDQIIFGKTEAEFGGAGPGAPAGANVADIGALFEKEPLVDTLPPPAAPEIPEAEKPSAAPGSQIDEKEEGIPEPICPSAGSFNEAVEQKRASDRALAESLGVKLAGPAGEAGEGGSGAGEAEEEEAGEEKPLTPESSSGWARPDLCGKRFCIVWEAVYKKESAYAANANCVACHFEKINDAFKKTLDRNLVPSKATGNLLEAPKCKRSMFNLKQNFILVPQPILTPPNDDIIVGGDIIKNLVDFYEKYYGQPGRCAGLNDLLRKQNKGEKVDQEEIKIAARSCKPPPEPAEEAAARVLEQTEGEKTTTDTMNDIRREVLGRQAEAMKEVQATVSAAEAENQATQFQVLLQEMETFNANFRAFESIFQNISSGASDSPCKVLKEKAQCS